MLIFCSLHSVQCTNITFPYIYIYICVCVCVCIYMCVCRWDESIWSWGAKYVFCLLQLDHSRAMLSLFQSTASLITFTIRRSARTMRTGTRPHCRLVKTAPWPYRALPYFSHVASTASTVWSLSAVPRKVSSDNVAVYLLLSRVYTGSSVVNALCSKTSSFRFVSDSYLTL